MSFLLWFFPQAHVVRFEIPPMMRYCAGTCPCTWVTAIALPNIVYFRKFQLERGNRWTRLTMLSYKTITSTNTVLNQFYHKFKNKHSFRRTGVLLLLGLKRSGKRRGQFNVRFTSAHSWIFFYNKLWIHHVHLRRVNMKNSSSQRNVWWDSPPTLRGIMAMDSTDRRNTHCCSMD